MRSATKAGRKRLIPSSHPYNPLTLEYDESAEGQNLKARDMKCKERAEMRGENIYTKGNSAWNPLTGKPLDYHYEVRRAPPAAPAAPAVPTYSRPF